MPSLAARVASGVGSVLAACCVGGMLIGAGPGSVTMGKVYPYAEPILDFLNVDNEWGFFAPNPDVGTVVRYQVTDADGEIHDFKLTEALNRWDPMFFRYTTLYMSIVEAQDPYEPGAIQVLCRQHAQLRPKEVAIVVAVQDVVTPDDFLEGRGILDDVHIEVRDPLPCEEAES